MAARRLRAAEPATLVFAGAALFAGVALLVWLSDLTFWRDEWDFLLHRRGFNAEVYFDPFVEHLLALSIGIYQLTVAIFGMESAAPTQVVAVALFITAAALLFVYLRRRVDAWLALAGVLPILFFGPSWDDLLFPFQMAFFGSMACGIGALLALDGESRRGDVIATALLTVGLLFSGLGVPFVVMAVVDIALTRERFQRAFVVVVPTALYAALVPALGPRRGDLHLLSQLPDLARIRERRSRVESLEPAGPRGLTRRDVGERARLGPAPAGDRGRLRGLADRLGRGSRQCRGVCGLWLPGSWCSGR